MDISRQPASASRIRMLGEVGLDRAGAGSWKRWMTESAVFRRLMLMRLG